MKTYSMPQGSAEWYAARLGVITASEADSLVSLTGKVRTGAGVDSYLHRKLAEKLLGWSPDQLEGFAVTQGKLIETICIPWFEFTFDKKVSRLGFCTSDDGRTGFSPDGILDDGSGLEIKSPQGPNQIKYLLDNKVPDDYVVQIQHSLMVSGAPYWTFVSYSMTLPALVLRVERDERIQAALSDAIAAFNERFDAALATLNARIKSDGGKP
jgi:predicted phage-related endonuclease